jgi:hypothetical protein
MKLFLAALALCSLPLAAQNGSEIKHLSIPAIPGLRPVAVAAAEIQRELPYPGVIHLKGSAEIRTPICVEGPKNTHVCGGYIVLRADEADFHVDSGQIDARGNVQVVQEPYRPVPVAR